MIRRFVTVSLLGGLAAVGYVGAQRLGRWLDGPIVETPAYTNPSATSDGRTPDDEDRTSGETPPSTGWRRWSATDDPVI